MHFKTGSLANHSLVLISVYFKHRLRILPVMVMEQLQILCLVSDERGPIGPYETDLLDYVAGSTKFNKFHFSFHYFY